MLRARPALVLPDGEAFLAQFVCERDFGGEGALVGHGVQWTRISAESKQVGKTSDETI
jgi:hypothetical protein